MFTNRYCGFQLTLNARERSWPCVCACVNVAKITSCGHVQFFKMYSSVEPQRTAPYSNDIRWRIIWQKLGLGFSHRKIAKGLQISVSTAHHTYTQFEATGDVSPVCRSARPDKRRLDEIHELYVLTLVSHNPGLYLSEICNKIHAATNISVSESTVCRILHCHGFSHKKIVQVAKQRCMDYRATFIANIVLYQMDMFVWVDETGSDRRDNIRKFGYAFKGEAPVYHRWLVRGNRISSIAAMCSEKIIEYEIINDTCNSEKFADFVCGTLIPNMVQFDGSSSRSVVILDNCSIHHTATVLDLFEEAGIVVLFYLLTAQTSCQLKRPLVTSKAI